MSLSTPHHRRPSVSVLLRVSIWSISIAVVLVLLGSLAWPFAPARASDGAHLANTNFTLYHLNFLKNNLGSSSALHVQAPALSETNLTLTFIPSAGGTPIVVNAVAPARGSLVRTAAMLDTLPDSFNGVLRIDASQFVTSAVVTSGSGSGDMTELSRGVEASAASASLIFLPLSHADGVVSAVRLFNPGASGANVTLTFYNSNGSQATTANQALPAGAGANILLAGVAGLPATFSGSVFASSDQPILGFTQYAAASPALRWLRPAFDLGSVSVFANLPRMLYAVDNGGGPQTTTIYVVNPTSGTSPVDFTFYDSAGNAVVSNERRFIPGKGLLKLEPPSVTGLSAGQTYAVKATGLNPIYLTEVTDYDGPSNFATDADVYNSGGFPGYLPYVRRSTESYSIISVLPQGSTPMTVTTTFYNLDGTTAATAITPNVPQNGWFRLDPRTVAGLPADFTGSAIVDAPGIVYVSVDAYGQATMPSPTPTTPPASPTPTTPPASPTPVLPTATMVPTPVVGPNDPPQVSVNYVAGAPGSSFVIRGFNFPPDRVVQLTVNGIALGQPVQSDSNGRFELVLSTAPTAQEGFYVVTATVVASSGASLANVSISGSDLVLYQLVTSGPDAVVRSVPPSGPATSLTVPQEVRAFTQPPFVYMPFVTK